MKFDGIPESPGVSGVPLPPSPESPSLNWEEAAERLCDATVQAAPKMVKAITDSLYEDLLYSVQDYLRDNVDYNLSSELRRARNAEREAIEALHRVAEALGSHHTGWPSGPSVNRVAELAVEQAEKLRALVGVCDRDEPLNREPGHGG